MYQDDALARYEERFQEDAAWFRRVNEMAVEAQSGAVSLRDLFKTYLDEPPKRLEDVLAERHEEIIEAINDSLEALDRPSGLLGRMSDLRDACWDIPPLRWLLGFLVGVPYRLTAENYPQISKHFWGVWKAQGMLRWIGHMVRRLFNFQF